MDPEALYPRTLIVGAHFTEDSGVGTFLGRLFSGWPAERLATVCDSRERPDWRRCRRQYRAGDLEYRLRAPFSWLAPAHFSGPLSPQREAAPTAAGAEAARGSRRARDLRRRFRRLLGGGEYLYRIGPSPQLLSWVRDFRPEVLYGHCSTLDSVLFLRAVQRALGLPLVVHFMDDFPEALYREGWLSGFVRERYLAEFTGLVGSAAGRIAICREMAEEYERRYRRPVRWLPMPVELDAYRSAARTQWAAARPFRLRYGGRVGWAIRESLADLAATVQALRQEGAELALDIVTFQQDAVPAACRASAGVAVHIPGPLADVPRLQSEADVLVVCYDFDPEAFRQARYSMPSKLADCMASGTPILVYGPAGLPVVEYARREGWGEVVDRRDPGALRGAVRELMASASLRERRGKIAQRLAFERHDAGAVSESLRMMLNRAASGGDGV
jgi:glycosyltransferase involved in cell wall biosynthesis